MPVAARGPLAWKIFLRATATVAIEQKYLSRDTWNLPDAHESRIIINSEKFKTISPDINESVFSQFLIFVNLTLNIT